MFRAAILLAPLLLLISAPLPAAEPKLNVADPAIHPYADPSKGREGYRLAGETVNEARVYDFYQRQVDFYMAMSPGEVPEILPAYPGLDAGKHGHWGKHNQNNHHDGRWNDIEMGEVWTHVFRANDLTVLKGVCARLGEERELSVCFDPQTLTYRALWKGGFLKFHPHRWGSSRNAQMDGEPIFAVKEAKMPKGASYTGFWRSGRTVGFRYKIGNVDITDVPWAEGDTFYRRIHVMSRVGFAAAKVDRLRIPLAEAAAGMNAIVVEKKNIQISTLGPEGLEIEKAEPDSMVLLAISKGEPPSEREGGFDEIPPPDIGLRWKETFKVESKLGEARGDSAFVVDDIGIPFDNPYNSVLQFTGIGFTRDAAYITTLAGEVWKVTGLEKDLNNVTWRRFATGLNQPIGVHVDENNVIRVLDRGQIYVLADLDKDGEAEYYENFANDFGGYDRSHSHTFGLHWTKDGAFHFVQRESILRNIGDAESNSRRTIETAWGVRNCMGIGGTDTLFWVAPQEGQWTPATSIIEVNQGEFYGLPGDRKKSGTIAAPLCFIPRGVDNSIGGMVEINKHATAWGEFKGLHVGLSYGSGVHYLILRDETGPRPQGAVVPLEGEFLAGSMRGAFNPRDGQLYVVGMDGWGDYSTQDGCFHRVRRDFDKKVYKPNKFKVYSNGILIDFTQRLDVDSPSDVKNYFAHAWNYEYSNRYGSPEFSARTPKSLGHDHIKIRSVKLFGEGDSLFVEMPDMEPVMQLHIRMHLKAADGTKFKTDLFASPMYPGGHFESDGLADPVLGKPTAIALRIDADPPEVATESGSKIEGERELLVEAIGGLQYKQKLLEAKPGEALALKLKNTDIMPHNLVIVAPGAAQKVGEASFKMLNDPDAGRKHYVPDLDEVLFHIPVINPSKEHTLHFRAPEKPGDYPYICTFPGHWQSMRGVLRVR